MYSILETKILTIYYGDKTCALPLYYVLKPIYTMLDSSIQNENGNQTKPNFLKATKIKEREGGGERGIEYV